MKPTYFTVAGTNHYFGNRFLERDMKVKLIKEPENEYDSEAIRVEVRGLGKIGYVANSPYSVIGESMSAGRLYDRIGEAAKGRVLYVTNRGILCELMNGIAKSEIDDRESVLDLTEDEGEDAEEDDEIYPF